jgi:hypothetical protein
VTILVYSLLAHSGISAAVVTALHHALLPRAADNNNGQHADKLGPALIQALLSFSYSSELCQQMLQAGALPVLTTMLQAPDIDCKDKMLPAVSSKLRRISCMGAMIWGKSLA